MKKALLLTIVILLCVGGVSAQQFTKGTKMLSANATGLDFGVTKYKGEDAFINLGLTAKGSSFVADNLAITAGLGFGYQKWGDANTNSFAFEAGARYYMVKALYGALGYEGAVSKDSDYISYGKIEVGYDIFISERVFFEPAVYFKKGFGNTAKDINQFGLSVGIGVKL